MEDLLLSNSSFLLHIKVTQSFMLCFALFLFIILIFNNYSFIQFIIEAMFCWMISCQQHLERN